jgi:hypothetical protein
MTWLWNPTSSYLWCADHHDIPEVKSLAEEPRSGPGLPGCLGTGTAPAAPRLSTETQEICF